MKLNPDCIRDILLTVEACEDLLITEEFIPSMLSAYPLEEILYHAKQCYENSYFLKYKVYIDGSCKIFDLSPSGHLMLQYIRDNSGFSKVKNLLLKKGLPFTWDAIKSVIELLT